jgi:DNA-binding beta-propeller fold protein YncE
MAVAPFLRRVVRLSGWVRAYLIPVALLWIVYGSARGEEPLRLVQTIPIPQVSGRLDHMTIDLERRRLFVAALESNSVEVVDVRDGRWIRSLPGFSKPQGVFYALDSRKLFVANGTDGTCRILDGETLALIHTEKLSLGADLVDYDRRAKQLYVGHGGKDAGNDYGEVSIINGETGARTAGFRVEAHPGAILVSRGREVFITVPEKAQIVAVNHETHAVDHTWTVEGGVRAVSVALDEPHHRLFVGTRNPPLIVVLDTGSGKEVARMPTVNTLDGLFFDRATRRLYASGGEGFIDVQRQIDPDHYEAVAHVPTGPNARTSLFVPELDRLFVAVPKSGDGSAEVRVFQVLN